MPETNAEPELGCFINISRSGKVYEIQYLFSNFVYCLDTYTKFVPRALAVTFQVAQEHS